mgnify:FL=1
MKDILSEIIANKRFEVDLQKQAISCLLYTSDAADEL